MDGDSEGMVAIVQPLHDAGLVVTLMDGGHRGILNLGLQERVARILALKKSLQAPQAHSSNGTMMGKCHSTAQVCDGRYASSYQMAHCNLNPISIQSPQFTPPEFPPQRASPIGGNFLVGAPESYTRIRSSQSYRNCTARQNRGLHLTRPSNTSEYYHRVSRDSEAFMYSLRKYPSISPVRPGSAEMVQRLINYTQSKNSKKHSHKSKSMRSLRDTKTKMESPSPKRSSKNIQTYTRNRTSPVNDVDNVEEKITRKFSLQNPEKDYKNVRNNDLSKHKINETYDYLETSMSPRRKFYRSAEVRYLSDVTRNFRDTLRHICEDRPVVCQKMRNRYTNHERQYHPGKQRHSCHHRSRMDSTDTEVQANLPTTSRGALKPVNVSTDTSPSPSCSIDCQEPCVCRPTNSIVLCACPKKLIDDAIFEWVKTIPIHSEESHREKRKRHSLVERLAFTLKDIVNDDDFDVKARDVIEKFVNDMPMWSVGSPIEQDILKNLIVYNLYNKITRKLNAKSAIRETVRKWLKELAGKDYTGNDIGKKQIIEDLVRKIKSLFMKKNDSENVFSAIRKEISYIMDSIPIMSKEVKNDIIDEIARKLTDALSSEDKERGRERKNNDAVESRQEESNYLRIVESHNKHLELTDRNVEDYEESQQFTLNSIRTRDADELIKTGFLDDGKKLEQLTNVGIKKELDKAVSSEFKKLVEEWINKIASLKGDVNQNRVNEDLARQLMEIKISNRMSEENSTRTPSIIPNETVDTIAFKIAKILVTEHEKMKNYDKLLKSRFKEEYSRKEVKKLVEDWRHKVKSLENNIERNKAIEDLTEQLLNKKSSNMQIEDMITHIRNVDPSDTVDGVVEKMIEVLIEKEEKRNMNALQMEHDREYFCEEVMKLVKVWDEKISKLQSSIDKNEAIDELTKQLLDIKSSNIYLKDVVDHLHQIIPSEVVDAVVEKLTAILDKVEKKWERDQLSKETLEEDLQKSVFEEVKRIIQDWDIKISKLQSNFDNNKAIQDLTRQLLQIKSTNLNIEEMIKNIQNVIPSETIEGVVKKLTEVLNNEREQKETKAKYNETRIEAHIEKTVYTEVKKLVDEWGAKLMKLQNKTDIVNAIEGLTKQLIEIKSTSRNIEDIMKRMQNVIPTQAVVGVTASISEVLVKEQEQRKKEELKEARIKNDDDNAVRAEVKKIIEELGTNYATLQSSIHQTPLTDKLSEQLLEIKSASTKIEEMISQVQNMIPNENIEGVSAKLAQILANDTQDGLVASLLEKIQTLEKLLADRASRLGELEDLKRNVQEARFNQNEGTQVREEKSSVYGKRIASFERITFKEPLGSSTKNLIDLPRKTMEASELDLKDSYITKDHNTVPSKLRLKSYYKDKHSLNDFTEDTTDVKIGESEKKQIEELIKSIQDLQKRGVDQDIILDNIDDWLDTLSKNTEVDIPIREREKVAKKLLEYLEKNKTRKRWDQSDIKQKTILSDISELIDNELIRFGKGGERSGGNTNLSILNRSKNVQDSDDLKEFIREELNEMLGEYQTGISNRELEDMISHMLADQILRGADNDSSRGKIYSMLQEDNIPKNKAAYISMKLADRVRELSLACKAKDSNIVFDRSKKLQTLSPFHNEAFKSNAKRVILDFINEFGKDVHDIKQIKKNDFTKELIDLISDILSEPSEETEDILKGAIWDYFNQISFQSNTPILDLLDELADRILNIVINASTPRKQKHFLPSTLNRVSSKQDQSSGRTKIDFKSIAINNEPTTSTIADLCPCDIQKSEGEYTKNLTNIITNWIENLSLHIGDKLKATIIRDLVSDILDRQKYLQLNPTTKVQDKELEHLKYQVFRWLNNLSGVQDFSSIIQRTEELMESIKRVYLPVLIRDLGERPGGIRSKIVEETFDSIVEEWFASLPLKTQKTCLEIIAMERLKANFKCRLENLRVSFKNDAMLEEIETFLHNYPLALENKNDKFINEKVNELMELLETVSQVNDKRMYGDGAKVIRLEDSEDRNQDSVADLSTSIKNNSRLQSIQEINIPKKPSHILCDYIMAWFYNLPIITDNKEQVEVMKSLKQILAGHLINIIGEINLNKDIFDDDYIYQEIVKDEIDDLLNQLPITVESKSQLPDRKEELVSKIMEARNKTKQEIAGQLYKRNLREIISKSLPAQSSMDLQDLAALDVLKDNLADAYMNLYFYGADDELKHRYKIKISEEITNFCDNYLTKYPDSPIDSEKLNLELYEALENVEIPSEAILMKEIEQARIRDEINDWIKHLPAGKLTNTEILQRNKMIALLAKKLYDIENDDGSEVKDKMKKELLKFLQKFPLTETDDKNISSHVDKFLINLNRSENSRQHNPSKNLRSINDSTVDSWKTINSNLNETIKSDSVTEPISNDLLNKTEECIKDNSELKKSKDGNGSRYIGRSPVTSCIPPSSLSVEDRAHLEEIKHRSPIASNLEQPGINRDVAVSPLPVEVASQTDLTLTCIEELPGTSGSPLRRPKSSKSTCHNAELCQSPVVNLYKACQTQDAVIDNTNTSCGQEMRSIILDPSHMPNEAFDFDNNNIQPNKGSSESQQQINKASGLGETTRAVIPDIDQNTSVGICPRIQNLSECYDQQCPSLLEFISREKRSNIRPTTEDNVSRKQKSMSDAFSSLNIQATSLNINQRHPGPSKCEIIPQVIIREYYWNSPNQDTRPEQNYLNNAREYQYLENQRNQGTSSQQRNISIKRGECTRINHENEDARTQQNCVSVRREQSRTNQENEDTRLEQGFMDNSRDYQTRTIQPENRISDRRDEQIKMDQENQDTRPQHSCLSTREYQSRTSRGIQDTRHQHSHLSRNRIENTTKNHENEDIRHQQRYNNTRIDQCGKQKEHCISHERYCQTTMPPRSQCVGKQDFNLERYRYCYGRNIRCPTSTRWEYFHSRPTQTNNQISRQRNDCSSDDYWTTNENSESREREHREGRVRCRCKQSLGMNNRQRCPYPSCLYFQ